LYVYRDNLQKLYCRLENSAKALGLFGKKYIILRHPIETTHNDIIDYNQTILNFKHQKSNEKRAVFDFVA